MQATGVLYQSLYDAITQIAWSSSTLSDKAIGFVESLQRKRHMENATPGEYTDLARNYFVKKYGGKYRSIIKPLLDHGILERTNYYRPGWTNDDGIYIKGQCYSYRISPALQDDDIIKVVYKGEKRQQRYRDDVTMTSKRILRQVRIPDLDSRQVIKYVKRSLTEPRIRKMLRVNDEIQDSQVHLKGYDHPISTATVRLGKKDLIKDGKYCHVEHLDIYIKRKRRHLTQAYCDQLLRLKHRNVYADRNDTNLRLDSNLTNLKSDYLSLLSIDGQRLSNVDLKNSQFRFFVYLLEQCERKILFLGGKTEKYLTEQNLEKTAKLEDWKVSKEGREIEGKPVTLLCTQMIDNCTEMQGAMVSFSKDYKKFKKLVKTGKLYERIRELIWIETGNEISRSEAKKAMFGLAFSSWKYQSAEKQVLKKYFPSVVAVIDGFKKGAELIDKGVSEKDIGLKLQTSNSGHNSPLSTNSPQPSRQSVTSSLEKRGSNSHLKPFYHGGTSSKGRGSARFAVMLQQVESLVFVDEILSQCYRKGLKVLSKHDSIVCRQCDKHKVTKIICRVLNRLFGKWTYALDIDGELFDLQPKRKSRLGRVADGVVKTLFGVVGLGNGPPEGLQLERQEVGRPLPQGGASLTQDSDTTLLGSQKVLDEGTRRFMAELRRRRDRSVGRSRDRDRW